MRRVSTAWASKPADTSVALATVQTTLPYMTLRLRPFALLVLQNGSGGLQPSRCQCVHGAASRR